MLRLLLTRPAGNGSRHGAAQGKQPRPRQPPPPLCDGPAASRTESSIASLTASKRCPLILGSRQPRLLLVRLGLRVYPTEGTGEAAAEAERRLMTRDRRRLGSTATFRVGGELDRLRLNVVTRTGAVAPIAKGIISPIHAGVLLSAKLYGLLIN